MLLTIIIIIIMNAISVTYSQETSRAPNKQSMIYVMKAVDVLRVASDTCCLRPCISKSVVSSARIDVESVLLQLKSPYATYRFVSISQILTDCRRTVICLTLAVSKWLQRWCCPPKESIHIRWHEPTYTRKMRIGKAVALDDFAQKVCRVGWYTDRRPKLSVLQSAVVDGTLDNW